MSRLVRIGLVAAPVMAVLGLGTAAVVLGALNAASRERRLSHQVVAERAFDAMEGALSELVAREEARSFLQYRYAYVPEGLLPGQSGLTRSPLSEPPTNPAVVGYFQIEPDGSVSTPMIPPEADPDGLDPELDTRAARLLALVTSATQNEYAVARPAPQPQVEQQAAASGRYAVEKSLNKSVLTRSGRKQQLTKAEAEGVRQFQSMEKAILESDARNTASNVWIAPASPTLGAALLPAVLDVTLSPLTGVAGADNTLILSRDVAVGGERYRQGLVVDLAATLRLVREAALAGSLLTDLAWIQGPGEAAPTDRGAWAYSFHHTFAPPFQTLQATLWLKTIPEEGSSLTDWLLRLSVVLAVVGLVGLVAVGRMVVVTVQFAERRSNFVAAVSHELKTPLTAIRMYAEMLRDDLVPSEDKRRAYYETITAESERLTRLIQNVLELARLERGTRALQVEVGDPVAVLREVARFLAPHAAERGFVLEVVAPDGLLSVRFDRDALTQVLMNLVDNAIKFSADATDKRVVLEAGLVEGGVSLSVRDFGPGVPQRHLRRIFEPFYRGERELVRRTQGTGIGLALVSGLVARMGGKVKAWNPPGGGLRVEIGLAQ